MRRHKKLMSLLLILTMITTMTPAIAFAAPNEPVEIKSVTITGIERPVDAEHPDFTAVIPEGAPYHFASREELEKFSYAYIEDNYNGIWWESVNGKMKPYELFEKGEIYTANMVLVPNDGYVFTSHVKVTINGETSHAGSYNDNMIIYSNDMEAASNHSQIADYSKVYAAFKKVPDNLFIYVDETVTKLNDACNAVKGGLDKTKQEEVDKMASDIETAIKGLEFKTEINSVEITDIKNPVIGENPVYSASLPENAPYHFASHEELIKADYSNIENIYNGIAWKYENKSMKPDEVFEIEKAYKPIVFLFPNDGYIFGSGLKVTLNGKICDEFNEWDTLLVYGNEMKAVKAEIAEVTLNESFSKVNDHTYKYRTRGKHVNAKPIVKDKKGNTLEENKDYKVTYSDDERKMPGKYMIKVEGIGNYKGTIEIVLVLTPEAVEDVKVRHTTAKGGYDDAYVTWDKSAGADGYQVYARRPSKTSEWTYLGRTEKTSFLEKDLYDGWKYEFKVIPYKMIDGTRFRTTAAYHKVSMTTLKKVSDPSVKKESKTRIRVSWKDISGESGYQVMASRKGKTTYFRTSGTTMKLKVAKGKKYTYKVRAYKNVTKNGKTYRVYAPWSDAEKYTLK